MKNLYLLFLFLIIISTACVPQNNISTSPGTPSNDLIDVSLHPNLEPLTFGLFDEFSNTVAMLRNNEQNSYINENADFIEKYNISSINGYYIPSVAPDTAKLNFIAVKDTYVVISYKISINLSETDSLFKEQLEKIVFEWTRTNDGKLLLENTIKNQNLQPLEGVPGYYFVDIYPGLETQSLVGRQYYWEQDGYMFMFYLPVSELDSFDFVEAVWVEV